MHFSNGRFSNKETGFSGPCVVWSRLGAAGEKKRENQMFLQDLCAFAPLESSCGKSMEKPTQEAPNENERKGKQLHEKAKTDSTRARPHEQG